MNDTFRPSLLLSMPQLQDPNFSRTVVLLCDFVPEGAFGLVLNRPTEMAANTMVRLDPDLAPVLLNLCTTAISVIRDQTIAEKLRRLYVRVLL